MNAKSAIATLRPPTRLPFEAAAVLARGKATHLSLQAALRRTLAFDVALPGAARIDFVEPADDAWVAARDADLRDTLKHLLAHAILHCPDARRIEVAVQADHPGATVVVRDAVRTRGAADGAPTIDIGLVRVRPHSALMEPELGRLQECARRLGARVLVADPRASLPGSAHAHGVLLSVQFPPPFNAVVRNV